MKVTVYLAAGSAGLVHRHRIAQLQSAQIDKFPADSMINSSRAPSETMIRFEHVVSLGFAVGCEGRSVPG